MTLEMEKKRQICELFYEVSASWTSCWLLHPRSLTVVLTSGTEPLQLPYGSTALHVTAPFGPLPWGTGAAALWAGLF